MEDAPGIDRYGYHETEVRAFGTTSQGQAQRIGRWILITNQLETETITFKTGTEGFFVLPGEIIGIADPAKGGKRYGGRVVSATTSAIIIDQEFTIAAGKSYSLSTMLPNGTLETKTVTNALGASSTITVSPAFSIAPASSAPWVMQEDAEGIRTFRVISLSENDGKVTVLASLYDDTKFTTTDNATILSKPRVSLATAQIVPQVINGSIVLGVPSDVAPA